MARRAPVARCLDLIDLLRDDKAYAIADRIIGTLWTVHELERGEPGEAAFHAWARALMQGPMARLGWEAKPGEKELDASWRSLVIELLGTFGDDAVRAEAQRRFRAFAAKGEPIPGDLRRTVFGLVGRDADAET